MYLRQSLLQATKIGKMKEDFLHYLWKFKKFESSDLKTYTGETLRITNVGQYLQMAGPDFFNAQISIDNQKWAGNVEIHIKSSDWYVHHHERDSAYESVILHVVWEHDTEIFRNNNTEIPVLELKNYVRKATLEQYQSLMFPKSWIYCEKQLESIGAFSLNNWLERVFFERLERKSNQIETVLVETNRDWEAVLFVLLAKNFGLNTNGILFMNIAESIPFSTIRKESFEIENIEALLFAKAGLLMNEKEDSYYANLKEKSNYLLNKYQLESTFLEPVQFFKHRPDNFPTIRLSQLANLYHSQKQLFSKVIAADSVAVIYELFKIAVSEYWQTHYQFDKESPRKQKVLSKSFIDLIIINTIIPIQFAYARSQGKAISENLIALLLQVAPESNSIIGKFNSFGIKARNAFESQSLLQLKNEYCNKGRCLDCAIGVSLLKS